MYPRDMPLELWEWCAWQAYYGQLGPDVVRRSLLLLQAARLAARLQRADSAILSTGPSIADGRQAVLPGRIAPWPCVSTLEHRLFALFAE